MYRCICHAMMSRFGPQGGAKGGGECGKQYDDAQVKINAKKATEIESVHAMHISCL